MASTSVIAKTVVIADDTAFVRDRFRAALENAGHKAIDGQERGGAAGARPRRSRADRSDRARPAAAARARASSWSASIRKLDDGRLPILIFSGTIASADEVRELAALGVAGYVNEYSAVQHILPSLAPHLFPDNFNRRSSPRVVLGIPDPVPVRQHDRGGADAQPEPRRHRDPHDEPARRRVARSRSGSACPDPSATSTPRASVAWSDRRVGMGIQFETVDPANQTMIDNFVDAHFFCNRKA